MQLEVAEIIVTDLDAALLGVAFFCYGNLLLSRRLPPPPFVEPLLFAVEAIVGLVEPC